MSLLNNIGQTSSSENIVNFSIECKDQLNNIYHIYEKLSNINEKIINKFMINNGYKFEDVANYDPINIFKYSIVSLLLIAFPELAKYIIGKPNYEFAFIYLSIILNDRKLLKKVKSSRSVSVRWIINKLKKNFRFSTECKDKLYNIYTELSTTYINIKGKVAMKDETVIYIDVVKQDTINIFKFSIVILFFLAFPESVNGQMNKKTYNYYLDYAFEYLSIILKNRELLNKVKNYLIGKIHAANGEIHAAKVKPSLNNQHINNYTENPYNFSKNLEAARGMQEPRVMQYGGSKKKKIKKTFKLYKNNKTRKTKNTKKSRK
jgi:hypothetical protein